MEGRGSGRREELDGVRMKELSSALADRVGRGTCQEAAIFLDQRPRNCGSDMYKGT